MRPPALAGTEDQIALADAVRGFAHSAAVTAQARTAMDEPADRLPECWHGLARQELLALPFDGGVTDVCVAVAELARSLTPGPVVPTLLAALLVARYGDAPTREHVEAGLRDGSFSATVPVGGVLLGGAAVSELLLERDGGWSLVRADTVTLASSPGVDPTRRVATLTDGLAATGRSLPGLTGSEVAAYAAVLLAADAVGTAAWCLDTAVDYAKVREQFGAPIGRFQAVKHRCADMLCGLELARAATWDAAGALEETPVDLSSADRSACELAVAVAAAVAPQAAVEAAKSLVQVLGGIGFTWEHDAHLYLKRALADRQLLGGAVTWQRRAAELARAGVRRRRSVELGPEADGHRREVRELLARLTELPEDERRIAIADAGYLVPHWPVPHGRAAGPVEQLVIDAEFARAGMDRPDLVIGNWALPTILAHGSEQQRARFGPPTLHGELTWCQMFSEPGAGSDLASLQTKAVRVEGGWSLTGQKVWTSQAQVADWAICLARTSNGARRHDGITYFLVDMRSPGLEVRPLRELTGEALFNEIFLNDVFVPDDCIVGEVDGGWRLARTTLANERVAMSSGAAFPSGVEDLLATLEHSATAGQGCLDDALLVEVGRLVCLAQADAMLGVRATLARVSGTDRTDPGAASSVRKLVGMHLRQDVAELALELLGPGATALPDEVSARALHRFLATRALTIAGGTSEVLHNVIGERILGLPR
jgi:alkylation response protein AidB-like acyl-CoA dehydrogenase